MLLDQSWEIFGNVLTLILKRDSNNKAMWKTGLTLRPPSSTIVPYANSRIQAVWHSDNISPTLSHIEALWKLKQTRNLADDNLFDGLRVTPFPVTKVCACANSHLLYS